MLDPAELTRLYAEQGTLQTGIVKSFQQQLYAHFHATSRPMPWRETRDPYCILVSEIMLQQTQVERVKLKYLEFIDRFPSLQELAAAPLVDVLKTWQGLGYNRRAIALKRCAEQIVERFNGVFPSSISQLESLPGIGPYTARAVAAFAFDIAEPCIETNIRTVFIHFFFHDQNSITDRDILPLVEKTLDRSAPRTWYYALMDYGVHLKRIHPNPSRRSRHHARQSLFEGSNRQLRSKLLRSIIAANGVTAAELSKQFQADHESIEKNLEAMAKEGFIYRDGQRFYVATDTKTG